MKITLITVGKIKEAFYRDAIGEYSKRLSRYCKLSVTEVSDEKTLEQPSEAQEQIIKEKEAQRILKNITDDMYVIVLAIDGKKLDSVQLSEMIAKLGVQSTSHIAFIIGGSLGLHLSVLDRADFKLSFLEQIYRSYRIMSNEPYHK